MFKVIVPVFRQVRVQSLCFLPHNVSSLRLFSTFPNLTQSSSVYYKELIINKTCKYTFPDSVSVSYTHDVVNKGTRTGSLLTRYTNNISFNYNCLSLNHKNKYQLINYRKFSTLKRLQFKRNFISGQRKNGSFPRIRYFRINPFVLVIGTFLSFTMFFLLLPIILKLMLPLIILAIVIYQFNKWKRGLFYQQVVKILPRSDIWVPYRTINSLQYSFIPERLLIMKDIKKDFSMFGDFNNVIKTKRDSIEFVQFVETRIMEALATDENGITSYIISNNSKFRSFQKLSNSSSSLSFFKLKLDTLSMKMYGERAGPTTSDIMLSIQYPLKLILKDNEQNSNPLFFGSSNNQQIYLGNATLTILDDSNSKMGGNAFRLLSELADTEAECKLVISIVPATSLSSPIPRQFIISTWGDSGLKFNKYHIKKTRDGHTEYTIR